MNIMKMIEDLNIPVVNTHGRFDSANALLEFTRPLEGVEGFVVAWNDGHRVKVKAEQYLRIHKVKDLIATERHIVSLVVNEELDDVIPVLDSGDIEKIRLCEHQLQNSIESVLARLDGLVLLARTVYGGNKKEVALNFVPNLLFKEDARFVFLALDGKNIREAVIDKIRNSVGNTTKYEQLKYWLEMN